METRFCTKCCRELDITSFSKKSESPSGYKSYCKSCDKQYYKDNYETIVANQRRRIAANPQKHKAYQQTYYLNNKEEIGLRLSKYREENSELYKTYNREYARKRKASDTSFKLGHILRSRLSSAIKNNQKSGSAVRDLGCSIEEFKMYIESKFQPGMSWDNWSKTGWHIDHIVPLDSFDLTDPEQLLKACHYTNLQPLWAKDNLKKSSKIKL